MCVLGCMWPMHLNKQTKIGCRCDCICGCAGVVLALSVEAVKRRNE